MILHQRHRLIQSILPSLALESIKQQETRPSLKVFQEVMDIHPSFTLIICCLEHGDFVKRFLS